MSRGDLQEMEVGTKQSKSAVNAGAKPAEAMPKLTTGIPDGQTGGWEDLGGPTPDNYRPDDSSAELKDPATKLKSVSAVNKGAKGADSMKGLKKGDAVKEEAEEDESEVIDEMTSEEVEEDMVTEASKSEEDDEEEKGEKEDEEDDEDDEDEKKEMKKEEYDIEEDVNALLSGEELSEEFQEKARMIFETAINSKVSEIKSSLEEHYAIALQEEVEEIKAEIQERVDTYLEYVAQEWITENQLAIEHGLKEELTESFMTGLKGLFEEHYVSIPEDKYDVLESMVEKLDEMETKLNEQIEKNIHLNKRLSEAVAEGIFDQVSEGLADTQKEKLASLAESVEFESESTYREKLETLKESYFPSRVASPSAKTETLSEGVDVGSEYQSHSDTMNAYLRTLSAVAKK
jgi:hypothetical protein